MAKVTKVTRYFYDGAGRMTKVGAGARGTIDPTEYEYHGSTGMLTKVKYTSGVNMKEVSYQYDLGRQVEKLVDWLSGGTANGGISYAYDDLGRVEAVTDYDGEMLEYVYDAGGRVESMTDYYGAETTYAYDGGGRLSTLTAQGNKTWTFSYNALGQRTQYTHGNGMTTVYGYDGRNRLTKIEHKDGAAVKLSYAYDLDKTGNILAITEVDGFSWDYEYDGRYRLESAVLSDGTRTRWHETYVYDAGDNLVTKQQPWARTFNDGSLTGWSVWGGGWDASNLYAEGDGGAQDDRLVKSLTDADYTLWFSYNLHEEDAQLHLYARLDGTDHVRLELCPDAMRVVDTTTQLGWNSGFGSAEDTWYDVCVRLDGGDMQVWRGPRGGAMQQAFDLGTLTTTGTTRVEFRGRFAPGL